MTTATPRVLVVAPHPDDETLGAGATLRKMADLGAETRLVVLTNRVFPNPDGGDARINPLLAHAEVQAVAGHLGIGSFFLAGYTDKELPDYRRELIGLFEAERDAFEPDLVLIPDEHDTHQDHRATYEAARVVWRPHLAKGVDLWSYQAPSSYGFVPNMFVSVTPEQVAAKTAALACYSTEQLPWPSTRCPDFIDAQAKYWGGVTQLERAEPFRHLMGVL